MEAVAFVYPSETPRLKLLMSGRLMLLRLSTTLLKTINTLPKDRFNGACYTDLEDGAHFDEGQTNGLTGRATNLSER